MEFPKTTAELGIWFAMQFPVLGVAGLLARWAVRYTERLYEKRIEDANRGFNLLLVEKDYRLQDRGDRIAQLEAEVVELRGKLSRSKKTTDESKLSEEGGELRWLPC